MKIIIRLTLLLAIIALHQQCFGVDDTNIVALGPWSEPIANDNGYALRGRLLMYAYPSHRGPATTSDLGVYLEIQEFSDSIGGDMQIYCDFMKGLKCELSDTLGKPVSESGTGFSGGALGPRWVSLPPYTSVRLRASLYGGGRLRDGGLGLWFMGAGTWTIKPADTNAYFLSATFTVDPPANSFNPIRVWRGTLKLPKLKVQ